MSEIAYKVVRAIDGRYYSGIVIGPHCKEYMPGIALNSPEMPVFIFRDRQLAFAFAFSRLHQVWKCEVEGLKEAPHVIPHSSCSHVFRSFWQDAYMSPMYLCVSVAHSYTATSVKLLEREYICNKVVA